MSARHEKPEVAERKASKWRFGRQRTSSGNKKPHRVSVSSASPPTSPGSPGLVGSPTSVGSCSAVGSQTSVGSRNSRGSRASEGSLQDHPLPSPPGSPVPPQLEAGIQGFVDTGRDRGMRELFRSLSMKDDPRMFGTGTIAARRMQREELDAAMAYSLFSRELAMMPQLAHDIASPINEISNTSDKFIVGDQLQPLVHLRAAFTEEQWAHFTVDPLRYIQAHGLPQEVQLVEVATTDGHPTHQLPEQLILPPEISLLLPPRFAGYTERLVVRQPDSQDVPLNEPEKGLTADEISCLLTTFTQKATVGRAVAKKRPSRIRGRTELPKGAKTKGIISDEEATECAICLLDLEMGQKVALLPCCHRFHDSCVVTWIKRDATCPECREPLRNHIQR